jgi:hypothetical protein
MCAELESTMAFVPRYLISAICIYQLYCSCVHIHAQCTHTSLMHSRSLGDNSLVDIEALAIANLSSLSYL